MKILFLCTQNACRSQMAELWTQHLHANRVHAASAGTHPAVPNPNMLTVMQEAGVDVSGAASESLDLYRDTDWDLVVTLCDSAAESCPVFPGARRVLHQPFPDPAHVQAEGEELLDAFRAVRDQIREFVSTLPDKELAPSTE